MKTVYVLTALNADRTRQRVMPGFAYTSYRAAASDAHKVRTEQWPQVTAHKYAKSIQVRAAELAPDGQAVATYYFDLKGDCAPELQGLNLACAVLQWAESPGEHGGNPYAKDFVKLARQIVGDE
jgi:hypothetical protein